MPRLDRDRSQRSPAQRTVDDDFDRPFVGRGDDADGGMALANPVAPPPTMRPSVTASRRRPTSCGCHPTAPKRGRDASSPVTACRRGARATVVRELNERLGLEQRITDHLSDSRHGTNTQFRVADLLRQSVYSRLAGYEDPNDAVGEFSEERWR